MHTWLLLWNEDTYPWNDPMLGYSTLLYEAEGNGAALGKWFCDSSAGIQADDRVFLLHCAAGQAPGILGRGTVLTNAFPAPVNSAARMAQHSFLNIRFDALFSPDRPRLPFETLQSIDSSGIWDTQSSGVLLSEELATKLDTAWENSPAPHFVPLACYVQKRSVQPYTWKHSTQPVLKDTLFDGTQRYISLPLDLEVAKTKYTISNLQTTEPAEFRIQNLVFHETGWKNLLFEVANVLAGSTLSYNADLSAYCPFWQSNQSVFSSEYQTVNHEPMDNGLWFKSTYDALHSYWILCYLLRWFHVSLEDASFVVHTPCSAESQEVVQFFSDALKEYCVHQFASQGYTRETVLSNLSLLENHYQDIGYPLNRNMLRGRSAYCFLFAFDDATTVSNYIKSKLLSLMRKRGAPATLLTFAENFAALYQTFLRKEYPQLIQ